MTEAARTLHTFTDTERNLAEELFKQEMLNVFGEIWNPKSDGQYIGKAWDCRSPLVFDGGIWTLCQHAKHAGALRVFGKIERREVSTLLRFIIFYERQKETLIT